MGSFLEWRCMGVPLFPDIIDMKRADLLPDPPEEQMKGG
jgi:hypothetical protein